MSDYKKTTNEVVLGEIKTFLSDRDYSVSEIKNNKKNDFGLILNSNHSLREVNVRIKRHLYDGVVATLEDVGIPYICSEEKKYEFVFRKTFPLEGKPLLSYSIKSNNNSGVAEYFSDLIYGTKKIQLKKLYEIMPELKYRVDFRIVDTLSETILNTTTAARIMTNFGDEAYFILAAGASTGMEIFAENHFTRKAMKISSLFPQAIYASLQESPRNTINKIVERRDVVAWERLMEITKKIAPEYGLSSAHSAVASRISKLEKIIIETPEKLKEEISGWRISDNEKFNKALKEIQPIDYGSIKEQLFEYVSFLEKKDLKRENVDVEKIVEKTAGGFAGKTSPELRKYLSENLKSVIKKPSKEKYLEAINLVKNDLEKNLWSDTGIFMSKFPLAWMASSNTGIPTSVLLGLYVGIEIMKVQNSVGFERINTFLRLNYILEELNKDPTISGGADMENIFDAHISKLESATTALGTGLGVVGQFYSKKTGGLTNVVMDGVAFGLMAWGVNLWYKYMNSTIERCESEIKASSKLINLEMK